MDNQKKETSVKMDKDTVIVMEECKTNKLVKAMVKALVKEKEEGKGVIETSIKKHK